jgi:hypothetical protein
VAHNVRRDPPAKLKGDLGLVGRASRQRGKRAFGVRRRRRRCRRFLSGGPKHIDACDDHHSRDRRSDHPADTRAASHADVVRRLRVCNKCLADRAPCAPPPACSMRRRPPPTVRRTAIESSAKPSHSRSPPPPSRNPSRSSPGPFPPRPAPQSSSRWQFFGADWFGRNQYPGRRGIYPRLVGQARASEGQ